MKILKICFALTLLLVTLDLSAQNKTESKKKKIETCEFSVQGVCTMCKDRIEKAALIKGVKMVEWDKESQILKVIYATKKVGEEEIHQAIADAGHDTEKVKAADGVYAKLPDCCAYRDGVEVH